MKRKYTKPVAEIIVFHYTETVVACSEYCPWNGCYHLPKNATATVSACEPKATTATTETGGTDQSTPNWECKSPDYYGC